MFALLRRWLSGGSHSPERRARLQLHSLEDRCTPAGDLVAQSLTLNTTGGGVSVRYTADAAHADTTAALYWADGPTFADRIGTPVKQLAVYRTVTDSGVVDIPASLLRSRPARATELLFVVDPANRVAEGDESNNVLSLALPDVTIQSVTTTDSRSVTINYQVNHVALDSIPLRLVRSADARFDTGDTALASVTLDGSIGTHTVTLDLDEPLAINPSRPYVVAQVDPANIIVELSEANNAGTFRKRELGVVTHGFNLFGALRFAFPGWITNVANQLRAQGYDRAFAFDWSVLSNIPAAGMTGAAATAMAARIDAEIAAMKALWPDDVIDVHLIGHSRGGPVISQVAEMLADNPEVVRGTLRLTFLDPHPATNADGRHEYDAAWLIGFPFEQAYLAFQAVAQDPDPVIAADVDISDVLYQHTATGVARPGSGERLLNLWGRVPVQNNSPFAISVTDLTRPGMSHGEVITWFMRFMLPKLGRGLA